MEYIHTEFVKRQQARKDSPIVVDVSATGRHADLVFVITEIENYDPNYDHLGEWVVSADEWTINRKSGVLYGKFIDEKLTMEIDPPASDRYTEQEEEAYERLLLERAVELGILLNDPHTATSYYTDYSGDSNKRIAVLWVEGYQIIQTGHKAYPDRNAYEYFQPEYLRSGPNLEVDPESIEHGIEDWLRMERMEQGWWYLALMQGILYFRGYEVGSVTMDWDSDYVWDHKDEIAKAMLADLDIDTKSLERRITELEDEIAALVNFSPDLLKDGAGK